MNKAFLLPALLLVMSTARLMSQNAANPAAKSDDPLAGLNLGDSPKPAAGATATADGTSSPYIKDFTGHLMIMDHGTPKDFDAASLSGVKYWAFYYSASWCPPCQEFTPHLVDFYRYFKKSHPNFELILVNRDRSEDDMLAYLKADEMTWPALKYSDRYLPKVVAQKSGTGIPDLMLMDGNGKVLSDSYQGTEYVGPEKVMDDIKTLVPAP